MCKTSDVEGYEVCGFSVTEDNASQYVERDAARMRVLEESVSMEAKGIEYRAGLGSLGTS